MYRQAIVLLLLCDFITLRTTFSRSWRHNVIWLHLQYACTRVCMKFDGKWNSSRHLLIRIKYWMGGTGVYIFCKIVFAFGRYAVHSNYLSDYELSSYHSSRKAYILSNFVHLVSLTTSDFWIPENPCAMRSTRVSNTGCSWQVCSRCSKFLLK